MDYELYSYYDESGVQHYGVIGMKWGVRRNPSRAFVKASKKAGKIEKKKAKANKKVEKYSKKLSDYRTYKRYKKMLRYNRRFHKYSAKVAKLENKGNKWTKKMEKAFANTKASDISPEALDIGKRYAYMLLKD